MTRAAPLAIVLLAGGAAPAAAQAPAPRALAIAAAAERLGAVPLWPGYAPLEIPLAVFDGTHTWLFRHPAPPEEFASVAGSAPAARRMAGRHPAATANSSAELGGVATATLLADGERGSVDELAATALHEAFHVFQRARHPRWQGNEGDLIRYPVADAPRLALRRAETAHLARALAAADLAAVACHAAEAMRARAARFAGLDAAFIAYERGSELNEGLATYIQLRALGRREVRLPAAEYPAAEVRQRFYGVGPAIAFLLDRLDAGWRERLEAADTLALDALLAAAAGDAAGCALDAAERAGIERAAADDVAGLLAARRARRQAFADAPGWRVIVEAAPGAPLWPQGFDPLNLEVLEDGLFHGRFLTLGNDAGSVRFVDGPGADASALTTAAGAHPLFNGVRRVEIAGLAAPAVTRDGAAVRLEAPGFEAVFRGAEVTRSGREVRVVLVPAR